MSHTKCSNPMMCKCKCDACSEAFVAHERALGDRYQSHCDDLSLRGLFLKLPHDAAETWLDAKLDGPKETTTNGRALDPAKPKFTVGELILNKSREPVVVNAVSFIHGRHVYSVTAILATSSDVSRLANVNARSRTIYEEALIEADLGDYRDIIGLLLDSRRRILDGVASVGAEYAAFRARAESEILRLRRLLEQKPTNGRPQRCVTIETDHGWDD